MKSLQDAFKIKQQILSRPIYHSQTPARGYQLGILLVIIICYLV